MEEMKRTIHDLAREIVELKKQIAALQDENMQLAKMLEPVQQSLPNLMPKITWE
jgi:prefoldin subunit 5